MVSSATDTPPLTNADRLTEAHAASEAKEWQRAADLWDALRADLPQDARCWHKAGEAYCHAGMFDQADHILDQAVALFPDDEWAAYLSIVVARRKADWPEALRRAEKMGRSFPDSWLPMVEEAGGIRRNTARGRETLPRRVLDKFPSGTLGSRAQRRAGRGSHLDEVGGALFQRAGRCGGSGSGARGRSASFAPAFADQPWRTVGDRRRGSPTRSSDRAAPRFPLAATAHREMIEVPVGGLVGSLTNLPIRTEKWCHYSAWT